METYFAVILLAVALIAAVILLINNTKLEAAKVQLTQTNQKLEENNLTLQLTVNNHLQTIEELKASNYHHSNQHQITQIKLQEAHNRIDEWEQMREQTLEHTKATIFEVGNKLTSQLINEHRRESLEISKKSHDKFAQTTKEFHQQFEHIIKSVATLDSQVKNSTETVNLVKQALLSPSGAGNLAEITLENILKASGLIADLDYQMQYSFTTVGDNTTLRPDAVIFLPGDNLMVIDSKASKFFIELAKFDNDEVRNKLLISMRNHLKTLKSKDYHNAIKENISKQEHYRKINHVSMLMFLPSELAIEKLTAIDKDLMVKAWDNHIYPTGPVGLVNILSHARFQIVQNKQVENYKNITDEIGNLVANLSNIYEHARKVGSSLHSATNNFDKFAGTFNSRIIPKIKKLNNLGVITKNKKVPPILERYQSIESSKMQTIDSKDDTNKIEEIA